MRVVVDNRQRLARVDCRVLRALAEQFSTLSGAAPDEVTIILVDDAGIAPINRAAVGHDGATDVITLSYEAIPGEEGGASAEIILNVERALGQRPEDPSLELAYYLAHAFDHLSGRDDATPAARTAMHRRERRWLVRVLREPAHRAGSQALSGRLVKVRG